jgi:hypothetical protein
MCTCQEKKSSENNLVQTGWLADDVMICLKALPTMIKQRLKVTLEDEPLK